MISLTIKMTSVMMSSYPPIRFIIFYIFNSPAESTARGLWTFTGEPEDTQGEHMPGIDKHSLPLI